MNAEEAFLRLTPFLQIRPEIHEVCRFGRQWVAPHEHADRRYIPFHVVTDGSCILDTATARGITLSKGDVAILPHGAPHSLRALEGRARTTRLMCGRLQVQRRATHCIISDLPEALPLTAADGTDCDRIRQLAEMIAAVSKENRLGSAALASELSRALIAVAIRAYAERQNRSEDTLILLSPTISRTTASIVSDPARPWTLDDLAAIAGTSRATLVRHFRKAIGRTPLEYLASVRLNLAHEQLRSTGKSIAQIAEDVGYGSDSGLTRAFTRRFGVSPAAARGKTAN